MMNRELKIDKDFKLTQLPYKRIKAEEFNNEISAIIDKFKKADSGEEQFVIHKEYYDLMSRTNTNMRLAEFRNCIDTTDKYYEEEQMYYDKVKPQINDMKMNYLRALYNSEHKDYLMKKLGETAFKDIEVQLKSISTDVVGLQQEENQLTSEYRKLTAEMEFNFRGESINYSSLDKYLDDEDRNIRIEAVKVRNKEFHKIADKLDDIYDRLVHNRNRQAEIMGYDNFVDLGYNRRGRNCYDKNDVAVFKNSVKEFIVPLASDMYEKRRMRLEVDKLDSIDQYAYYKEGNPVPVVDAYGIFKAGQKMYSEMSEETKEFFDYMLEHELFDVAGKKNKVPGGYMDMLTLYKSPIIYGDFNGSSFDVTVMTHECGHAFQGYLTRNYEIMEHNQITYDCAEVHSMSMEFFTGKWMELFFGDRAEDFRTMMIERTIGIICRGCMVDEFQEIIYTNPDLSPEERRKVWQKLEKEYTPHMNYEYDDFFGEGRYWQMQGNIYNTPFYYIDYCLAGICALQFKTNMDQDFDKAWDSYIVFCKESAKGYFTDMLEKAHINNPFKAETVKYLAEELKAVINKQ